MGESDGWHVSELKEVVAGGGAEGGFMLRVEVAVLVCV